MLKKIVLLLSLIIFSFPTLAQDESLFKSDLIPDELKVNANSVVRLNDLSITITSQNEMTINSTRIVTVLNEEGNFDVRAIVGYDQYRKIKKIEAIVYDDSGEEIKKIKKRDFIDHSAVDGGTLYSDSRVLFMGYTPLSYPYTVKFTYEMETPNTAAIYSWSPIDSYFMAIQKSNYSVIDNANLNLRFKEKFFEGYNVERNNTDNSLQYSLHNIPALKPEDLSPGLSQFTPQLLVAVETFHYNGVDGQGKDWKEFGNWVNNALLNGRGEVSDQTKRKVIELTSHIEDPIEKAKIIYKYVQDNTRYISVQVGIGGIQPIAASEVDELKYGDCKGLTNYTQALLREVGVESYYTHVTAGSQIEDFEDDFATLEQGNHIILCIPYNDEMVWLDCTSQIQPFGFIGDFTDNRKVLIVKENDSKILKTTKYINEVNEQVTFAEINLLKDLSITADVKITTKGIQYDSRFYIERALDKEILQYYKSYWSYLKDLNILTKAFNNDKDKVSFEEQLKLNSSAYASMSGDNLIFTPNVFNRNTYLPERYRNRKSPFVIQRGYLDSDTFEISIPEGYVVEAIPEKVEIKNKFGEYFMESKSENGNIIFTRRLLIKKGDYSKTDYDDYRAFRKKITKHDESSIVLKPI